MLWQGLELWKICYLDLAKLILIVAAPVSQCEPHGIGSLARLTARSEGDEEDRIQESELNHIIGLEILQVRAHKNFMRRSRSRESALPLVSRSDIHHVLLRD